MATAFTFAAALDRADELARKGQSSFTVYKNRNNPQDFIVKENAGERPPTEHCDAMHTAAWVDGGIDWYEHPANIEYRADYSPLTNAEIAAPADCDGILTRGALIKSLRELLWASEDWANLSERSRAAYQNQARRTLAMAEAESAGRIVPPHGSGP